MKKVKGEPLPPNRIFDVDLYQYHPEDLASKYYSLYTTIYYLLPLNPNNGNHSILIIFLFPLLFFLYSFPCFLTLLVSYYRFVVVYYIFTFFFFLIYIYIYIWVMLHTQIILQHFYKLLMSNTFSLLDRRNLSVMYIYCYIFYDNITVCAASFSSVFCFVLFFCFFFKSYTSCRL